MGKPIEGGAVLLARALKESGVWKMPPAYVKLWIYILTSARWDTRPYRIGSVVVGFGEVVKSYRVIAEENTWVENRRERRWSNSMIGRMLGWFEGEDMVRCNGTDLGTLIHVRNFKRYQDFGAYVTGVGTDLGTTEGQPRDNRKQGKQESVVTGDAPEKLSTSVEEQASGIIMHANLGMADNATIDQGRLRPILGSHGSRQFVVDWLLDGIPVETIHEVVGDVARTAPLNGGQIHSMRYFDRPVREAWEREQQAKEASDGTVVRIDERIAGRGKRAGGPRRWSGGTPTDDFDAESGWAS